MTASRVSLRAAGWAALELVLPVHCAGCGADGRSWCGQCQATALATCFADGAREVRPLPCPAGFPPSYAASPYSGPVRAALVAYKDEGRTDLARVLAPLLARSLLGCLAAAGPRRRILVVPVPSSAAAVRRRGRRPLDDLLRRSLEAARTGAGARLVADPLLRVRRPVADQAGLGWVARGDNLDHAFAVRPGRAASVPGATCVLVDDVVTTGATLVEAARALRAAGATGVWAATIAATQRRGFGGSGGSP